MQLKRALAVAVLLLAEIARADEACSNAFAQVQVSMKASKLVAARADALECLRTCADEAPRDRCTLWLAEVGERIPSIILVVTKDGVDVADATVTLDGATQPRGIEVRVDPGVHALHVSASGIVPRDLEIVANEGEKLRRVAIAVRPILEPPPPLPPPKRSRPIPWYTWTLTTIGGIGLATFAGFAIAGEVRYNDLKACNPQCSPDAVSTTGALYTVADIGLVVSLVSLGAALVTFLVRPTVVEAR